MKALFFILLTYSSFALAEGYRLTGRFTLFGGTSAPLNGNFVLTWNEEDNFINGRYSDNVLISQAAAVGIFQQDKRVFQVVLPQPDPRHGVKSLMIGTTALKGLVPNAQTTILAKDATGNSMQSAIVLASLNQDTIASMEAQEDNDCAIGFGALTGLCGLYGGTVVEEADARNVCELQNMRVELAPSGNLNLYFQFGGNLLGIPQHQMGSILGGPVDLNIQRSVRHCGALPGTRLISTGCQTLQLVGSFQDFGTRKTFAGTYDIKDEVTGNTCRYRFNLGREVAY